MSVWSDLGISGEPLPQGALEGRVVLALHWNALDPLSVDALRALSVLQARCIERPVLCLPIHVSLTTDSSSDAEGGREPIDAVLRAAAPSLPRGLHCDSEQLGALEIGGLPTLTLIGAEGVVRARVPGVPDVERVLPAIDQLALAAAGASISFDEIFGDGGDPEQSMPAGLAVDESRGLLWVAQSDRHRVLAVSLEDGSVVETIGGPSPGSTDGSFEVATFSSPSGIAVGDGRIYVTDDVDHVVRCLDPDRRVVSRILGCGHARQDTLGGQTGFDQGLVSPRGPGWAAGLLVFANTGTDQLFLVHEDGFSLPFVGDGRQGQGEGHREDTGCDLPIATSVQGDEVAWLDAGSGSLRTCGISTGYIDELIPPGEELGRPGGLCWHGEKILVTDTLGGRLLSVDVRDRTVVEVISGLPSPGALAVHDEMAFMSCYGRESLLRIDLAEGVSSDFAEALTETVQQPALEVVVRREADLTLSLAAPWPDGEEIAADDRAWISIAMLAADADGLAEVTSPLERVGGSDALCVRALRSGSADRAAAKIRVFAITRSDYHGADHVQRIHCALTVVTDPEGPEEVSLPALRTVR